MCLFPAAGDRKPGGKPGGCGFMEPQECPRAALGGLKWWTVQ